MNQPVILDLPTQRLLWVLTDTIDRASRTEREDTWQTVGVVAQALTDRLRETGLIPELASLRPDMSRDVTHGHEKDGNE